VSTPSQAPGREPKVARVIDRDVAPVWHDRFARMLLRHVPNRPEAFVLDVHCGSGRTTHELLQHLDESTRVLALEDDANQLALARARMRPEWKQRVYFKPGSFDDVPEMEDATYDVCVANLVLGEIVHDWRTALAELVRVTKPGGHVVVTLPLAGSWAEPEELVEEILREGGRRDLVPLLHRIRRIRPRVESIVDACRNLGLDHEAAVIERETYELLFRSGREFLFAPVVEYGPLRLWKAVFAQAGDPQAAFWSLKEAIDTYWQGRVFAVTIHAGVIALRVPGGPAEPLATRYWRSFPTLDAIFRGGAITPDNPEASREPEELSAPTEMDELDLDVDLDTDSDHEAHPTRASEGDAPPLDPASHLAGQPIDPHGLFGEPSPEESLSAGVIPFDEPDLLTPLPSIMPSQSRVAEQAAAAARTAASQLADVAGAGATAIPAPSNASPAATGPRPPTSAPSTGQSPGRLDALRERLNRRRAGKDEEKP